MLARSRGRHGGLDARERRGMPSFKGETRLPQDKREKTFGEMMTGVWRSGKDATLATKVALLIRVDVDDAHSGFSLRQNNDDLTASASQRHRAMSVCLCIDITSDLWSSVGSGHVQCRCDTALLLQRTKANAPNRSLMNRHATMLSDTSRDPWQGIR